VAIYHLLHAVLSIVKISVSYQLPFGLSQIRILASMWMAVSQLTKANAEGMKTSFCMVDVIFLSNSLEQPNH